MINLRSFDVYIMDNDMREKDEKDIDKCKSKDRSSNKFLLCGRYARHTKRIDIC